MKSNIIKAAINFSVFPCPKIKQVYSEFGRTDDTKEAILEYIKDLFTTTVTEENAALRNKKHKQVFEQDVEGYPTFAIAGGDGDVAILSYVSEKDEDITLPSPVTRRFSFNEDEEKYESSDDGENMALYITACTDGEMLKGLYMAYGDNYISRAGEGTTVKNVKVAFSDVIESLDCKFEAFAIIPKEYYSTLNLQNRLEIETLVVQNRILQSKDVTVDGTEYKIFFAQL